MRDEVACGETSKIVLDEVAHNKVGKVTLNEIACSEMDKIMLSEAGHDKVGENVLDEATYNKASKTASFGSMTGMHVVEESRH